MAGKWVTPVRDYYDPGRTSYGFSVTKDFTAFVGSVHIGDDAGWNKELRTVVAVAPGVVRSVQHIFSWGFIVVIEHKDAKGEPFCSLYAHLSPMLHVKPGERVEGGQKIASIGRSHTVDNGGYHAHVHVGLHHGEYNEGNWVHGYISLKSWQDGLHDWMDPQKFLKDHDAP
ncbi:MAG: peptidoglycan DD-metalloendopeptidase family protein [Planctomycetes bacterium]|nr:peptidoglycan DD-metalloendopeptidase family protein [Planctomycetota bacterium]